MADRESIQKTIDTYLATFSADDRDGWLDCFAPDAWVEDPVGTPRRTGREAIGGFWDETHAVPDRVELRATGVTVITESEAAFTMQARPSLGGETYVIDVIDVMTFDDDAKITSMRAFVAAEGMRPAG